MADEETRADSLEAAFSLVAHDLRFEILQALWTAQQADETPVRFSALFDSVDARDSSKFNYHLDKLVPRFVRNVDEAYELTFAGEQIVGAAASGVYTDTDVTVSPMAVGDCPQCDGTMEARYEAGQLAVECTEGDLVITDGLPAPPVLAANHDAEDLPHVFNQLLLTRIGTLNRGFCQLCGGPVEPSLDDSWEDLHVQQACLECGSTIGMSILAVVLDHPAVVSFLYDAGINLRETFLWELESLFDADATVTNEEPLGIDMAIEYDDERLVLTLDESFDVEHATRE